MIVEDNETKGQANRQIARAAGLVMLAYILSNVVGLIKTILISRAFGTNIEYDAFNVANRYPDLIFNLIAGGALASAFIPTLSGFLSKKDDKGAWALTSSIINLVILVLTFISIISAIFPQVIIQYLAPDFSAADQALAASLLPILLISPVVFGVSGIIMGVLNTHQHFLMPALASTMLWIGYIFGLIFLTPFWGIYGLAWGAVIGSFLHIGIQLPGFIRLPNRRYHLSIGRKNPAVKEVIWLMGPRLLGVAVVQINFIVNVMIASGQPQGSISALNYAFPIMLMPEVAIAQAIAVAALPTFSAQVARGELSQMRHSLASTLRSVLLLSVPATLGLILLRGPFISMLLQGGMFDSRSADMVSWALLWYTAGLVGHSVVEILSRAFYALHDTKTPVLVGTVAMSLNIAFSYAFSYLFNAIGWMPHGGLAFANTLATFLEMCGLYYLMRRRLKGIEGSYIAAGTGYAVGATALMSAAILFWMNYTGGLNSWIIGLGGIAIGGMVYGLCVYIMRVPEIKSLLAAVGRRLPGLGKQTGQ